MKVVILHPHIAYPGGASKYMLEVGERLSRNGWDVLVVTTKVNQEVIKPYSHLKFFSIGSLTTGNFFFWLFYPLFQWRLHRFLNQFDSKILFPQILPPIWWAGIYKKFHPQVPVVWMCQEPSAFVHSPLVIESLPQPMKTLVKITNPFLKVLDRFLVKDIDYIIVNSYYGSGLVKKVYRRKADLVVYPSVDLQRFRPQGKKKNYLFTVSRLDKQKNIDVLIRAFRLLPKRLQAEYQLVIGGQGVEKKNLEDLAQKLKIGKRVKFLGWIKEEELPRWYAEAKLVVFCAQDEPFGIIPIEAMACGTPVIAFRSGGVVESISEEETGYLINKVDDVLLSKKIASLLQNEKGVNKMRLNASKHVKKNFSWAKASYQIGSFLKELANKNSF